MPIRDHFLASPGRHRAPRRRTQSVILPAAASPQSFDGHVPVGTGARPAAFSGPGRAHSGRPADYRADRGPLTTAGVLPGQSMPQGSVGTVARHRFTEPDPAADGRGGRIRTVALRVAVGLAISAAFMLVFLRQVGLGAVYHHLLHLSITFALLDGIVFLGAYAVRAVRWRWLLRPCQVSVGRAVMIYQVATFFNWLLPVQGGELAKSLLLQRSDGIPVSRSFATVSMDKTMDLLPAVGILVLLPFGALHLSGLVWSALILALGALGVAFGVIALAAWKRGRTVAVLTRSLGSVLRGRARDRVEPAIMLFVDTLRALVRRPRVLLVATVYTVAAASLDMLSWLFAFRAVGVSLGLVVVFYGYLFMNLTFILPTPPGHVGFAELMGLLIFSGLLGVNRSEVAAMALFAHAFEGVLLTCAALFGLSRMGLGLRSSLRLMRKEAAKAHDSPHDGNRRSSSASSLTTCSSTTAEAAVRNSSIKLSLREEGPK